MCVLAIQIDLAVGGLSFITIFIIGFALFAIIYLALYPYWNKISNFKLNKYFILKKLTLFKQSLLYELIVSRTNHPIEKSPHDHYYCGPTC